MRDDDVRELFAPLRRTTEPAAEVVAQVRAAAADAPVPSTTPSAGRGTRSRRRWIVSGATVAAAVVATGAAVIVVDQNHPGTFVGEAGARELLHAAADAAREDPAPGGWRLRRTERVQRLAFQGRRCPTCAPGRAVLETSSTEDLWSGPRGETYTVDRQAAPRAIENEPLLRERHALDPPVRAPEYRGAHLLPAPRGSDDRDSSLGLGQPGAIVEPAAIPHEPGRLVRWVGRRLDDQDRAQRAQMRGRGTLVSGITRGTQISYALVDLATSPQLSGAQQAAAFDALAERSGVTAVPAPAAFASPDRVAVRIVARASAAVARSGLPGLQDRVVVFDRSTHRVVAEELQPTTGDPRTIFQFGEGRNRGSLHQVAGGGGETRYGDPVDVPGPGLDARGHRVDPLTRLLVTGRDGMRVGFRPLDRRAARAAARRGARAAEHRRRAGTTRAPSG